TVKMAVFAPIPSASAATATAVKPAFDRRVRKAYFTSAKKGLIVENNASGEAVVQKKCGTPAGGSARGRVSRLPHAALIEQATSRWTAQLAARRPALRIALADVH